MSTMEMDTELFHLPTKVPSPQTPTDSLPFQSLFLSFTLRNTTLNLRGKVGHRSRSQSGASSHGSSLSISASDYMERITFPVNRSRSRILIHSNMLVDVDIVFNGKTGQEENGQSLRLTTDVIYYPH